MYIFLLLPIAADFVVGVTAVDQDSGNNGKVHYTLEGPDKTFFHIGSATGVITHAGRVQKQRTTFTFTVRASDLVLFFIYTTVPTIITGSENENRGGSIYLI